MVIIVMNDAIRKPSDELFKYQTGRLKELVDGIVQCCQLQTSFLSRKFNVPQAEIRCLLLFIGERYLTVKGIAQKLDVAKSRVTKITAGLQQKGLIECSDDPRDKRVKLFSLTPSGHKQCVEMEKHIWGSHEKLLTELDPEERRGVIASLEALRAGMEAIKRELAE